MRAARAATPRSRTFADLPHPYGAVGPWLPSTGNSSTTSCSVPARQRSRRSLPPPASDSAAEIARPSSVRGSNANALPATPSNTSPTASLPSAGEPSATAVIRTCRASVVTMRSQYIQPRAPVGPSCQSCSARSGIASPLVKSGIGGACRPWASKTDPMANTVKHGAIRREELGGVMDVLTKQGNKRGSKDADRDITDRATSSVAVPSAVDPRVRRRTGSAGSRTGSARPARPP